MSTDALLTNTSQDNAQNCFIVSRSFTFNPADNPDNIIPRETTQFIAKVSDGVVSPVIAFIGLPLNVVNCLVFFKQGVRDRINLLLFCQAFVDSLVDVAVILHSMEYFYMVLAGNFQVFGPWMRFKQNNGINTFYGFVYVSAFVSTMIACERCLCITYPFKAKKFFKSSTSAIFVAVAAVALVGLHYIIGDKFRIGCVHYTQLNMTIMGFIPSQFYLQHRKLVDILNGVLYGFGLPCFFVTTTVITTIITTVKLRTAAAWRQQMSSVREDHGNEVAVTKMLIAVSCLFIVCTLPNILIRLMPVFITEFNLGGRYQNLYMGFIATLHVPPAINSALNFFFYVRMGTKFRQTLKQLCCACRKTLEKRVNVMSKLAAQ